MKNTIGYFDLNIGPYCTKDCMFCSEGGLGKRNYITKLDFEKLYIENNIDKVILTGGEPLFNSDIIDYIKIGVRNGTKVGLVTSGNSNFKGDFLVNLLDAGLSEIMISLEGPEKLHDKIVKKEGSYAILLNSLYELSLLKNTYDFKLIVNTNINLLNYKILPNFIIKLLNNFKIDIYHLQWLQFEGKAVDNFNLLFGSYNKLLSYINNSSDLLNYSNRLKFGRVPFCVLNTKLYSSHTNTNYDINTNDDEGLRSYNYLEEKYIDDKCKTCSKFRECEYFYKYYVDKFGSEEINPI